MGKLVIVEMNEQELNEILEKLESKKIDCESFSKKYQTRKGKTFTNIKMQNQHLTNLFHL